MDIAYVSTYVIYIKDLRYVNSSVLLDGNYVIIPHTHYVTLVTN